MKISDLPWQPVVSCRSDATVARALELLRNEAVDAALIVDDDQALGYFTRDDVKRAHLNAGLTWADVTVGPYARAPGYQVEPVSDALTALRRMGDQHLLMVPVIERGRLVGIVTRRVLEMRSKTRRSCSKRRKAEPIH